MALRGIRGATVVETDQPEPILARTTELLETIVTTNGVAVEDIASAIFTVTPDIRSEYPARAARRLGWDAVALLGGTEVDVPGGLPRCIRVLLHVHTARSQQELTHVYLHDARKLRPDLSSPPSQP